MNAAAIASKEMQCLNLNCQITMFPFALVSAFACVAELHKLIPALLAK
jgi:hypothetical protein